MLTSTMEHPSRDQTPLRSFPFQARALHFFRKFALRTRGNGRMPRSTVTPVALPTQDFQRAHSSVDILRKPDISIQVGPSLMDTDDSSQDASPSGSSPRLRSRRHSTWDYLHTPPIQPTFTCRGAAPSGNEPLPDNSGDAPAPAALSSRSNVSLDAVVQPSRSPVSNPVIFPQTIVAPEPKPDEAAVQNTLNDDIPRPLGDALPRDATLTIPFTDLTPSALGDLSRPKSAPALEDSTEGIPKRPALLPRHSAPHSPPFRLATQRGLRLSPSIVARQPMPILKLPALPPPAQDTQPRQKVPLRSMPSLSRHGRSNADCQADHETATLEDSDEDGDGDGDEPDEDEEPTDALSIHQSDEDEEDDPPSAGPSGTHGFKSLQKRRMRDDDSAGEHPISPTLAKSEFAGPNFAGYICSTTYVNNIHLATTSTSPAVYPFSPTIPDTRDVEQDPDLPISGRPERKPSLYRVTSRSMINLGSTRRGERGPRHPKSKETIGSASGQTAETHAESEESETEAVIGRLLRRTSMPSFHPTSEPPPYPTFDPRPKVMPLEDEGREPLPPYSNSLYLIGIMPRKMEFSSPGVQAKDRKWRRVVCELEGTAFRVYKCPPGVSGAGVIGDWWEKRVGVGDVTSPTPPRTRRKEEETEWPAKGDINEPQRERTESQSSTPRHAKRISGASFLSPFRNRPETNGGESSRDRSDSLSRESTRIPFSGRWRHGEITKPGKSELMRAYTLQHAESGLGNDYLKRKNVIRVRVEGEQFLLQARDIPAVVEWIEGLHAGSNIALDLDERAMPRGPMFPRRRRRRMRRVEEERRVN